MTHRNEAGPHSVYIEATELGDVIATAGLPWLQGVETPFENSSAVDSGCGQVRNLKHANPPLALARYL